MVDEAEKVADRLGVVVITLPVRLADEQNDTRRNTDQERERDSETHERRLAESETRQRRSISGFGRRRGSDCRLAQSV